MIKIIDPIEEVWETNNVKHIKYKTNQNIVEDWDDEPSAFDILMILLGLIDHV